jgi:hypothetical protein
MTLTEFGALAFGVAIGFLTYRTLVRTADKAAITDLAAVLGAVGGGVVTKLYDPAARPFAWYAIGLLAGLAMFFLAFWAMNGRTKLAAVMSGDTLVTGAGRAVGGQAERGGGPRA